MTQKLNTDNGFKDSGQQPLAITAPTQKAGGRVPKTVLWVIKL